VTVFLVVEAVQSLDHTIVHHIQAFLMLGAEDEIKAHRRLLTGRGIGSVVIDGERLRELEFSLGSSEEGPVVSQHPLLKRGRPATPVVATALDPPRIELIPREIERLRQILG
jgi:hypothetical protein